MSKQENDPDDRAHGAVVDALRSLVLASHELRQAVARTLGLSVTETVLLSHLAEAKTLTAGQLARRSGLAPSTITGLCDQLVRAGLIQRRTEPGNRRIQVISLTEHGQRVLQYSTTFTQAATSSLDPDTADHAAHTLSTLALALREQATTINSTPCPKRNQAPEVKPRTSAAMTPSTPLGLGR